MERQIEDRTARMVLRMTYVGTAVGFIAYLIVGAVPGMLYGSYMGLIMSGAILGTPVEPTLLAKLMTGGGMILGLLASLFFFLVVGALTGTLLSWPARPLLRLLARRQSRPTPTVPAVENPPPGRVVAGLKASLKKAQPEETEGKTAAG